MPIVKVQRPLTAIWPSPDRQCLVYPRNRVHAREQVVSDRVWKALAAGLKGYFEARWDDDAGVWIIGELAPPQEW